ncbi:hypothetical protein ACS0TY_018444 [Phlomoides rotata]
MSFFILQLVHFRNPRSISSWCILHLAILYRILLCVLFVILGLLAIGAFSVFLYKLWQRKKREEQHTRLLKLFKEDDELEVELGIRD